MTRTMIDVGRALERAPDSTRVAALRRLNPDQRHEALIAVVLARVADNERREARREE